MIATLTRAALPADKKTRICFDFVIQQEHGFLKTVKNPTVNKGTRRIPVVY